MTRHRSVDRRRGPTPTRWVLAATASLMVGVAACTSDPVDETSSAPITADDVPAGDDPQNATDSHPSIRFAVIGDFGTDCCGEPDVADLVADWNPDVIVTVGDNRYDDVAIDDAIGQYYSNFIGNYVGDYGPGSEANRFFPAAGNHDYSAVGGFDDHLDYFDLPGDGIETTGTSGNERYYDFVQDAVHFFVVNSNEEEPDGITADSEQAAWLETQLAASTSPWKIVVTHHPPHSSGYHGPTSELQWPFTDWGVDLVLSGHEHSYERITKDGMPYIVNGSGGRTLRGLEDEDPDSDIFFDDEYGALFVEGCETQLVLEFRSVDDEVIDDLTLGTTAC